MAAQAPVWAHSLDDAAVIVAKRDNSGRSYLVRSLSVILPPLLMHRQLRSSDRPHFDPCRTANLDVNGSPGKEIRLIAMLPFGPEPDNQRPPSPRLPVNDDSHSVCITPSRPAVRVTGDCDDELAPIECHRSENASAGSGSRSCKIDEEKVLDPDVDLGASCSIAGSANGDGNSNSELEECSCTAPSVLEASLWATSRARGPLATMCCISVEEDILSLLNIAFQVSEFDTPVIGLSFSDAERSSQSVCQVLFGWVERGLDTDAIVRHVAIRQQDSAMPPPPMRRDDTFRLEEPQDGIALARFIVQAGTHLEQICRAKNLSNEHGTGHDLWSPDVYVEDSRIMMWSQEVAGHQETEPRIQRFPWAYEPNQTSGENEYPNSENPGLVEWSLDQHVLPVPSPPWFGNDQVPFLDDHRIPEQLVEYLSCASGELVPQRESAIADTATFTHTPLSIVIREMILSEGHGDDLPLSYHGSGPSIYRPWDEVTSWFWARSEFDDTVDSSLRSTYRGCSDVHLSRCVEFDDWVRVQQLAMQESPKLAWREGLLPYDRFYEALRRNTRFFSAEFFAGLVSSNSKEDLSRTDEVETTMKQVFGVADSIREMRAWLSENFKDIEGVRAESDAIAAECRQRLARYPARATLEGAVTVELEDVADHLRSIEGASGAEDLMGTLSFFRSHGGGVRSLSLPLLLITHQDYGTALVDSTVTEQRLACVSAVRFLAALGITDFPIYGLATYGRFGVACQAWYSTAHQCCYIVDCDILKHRFDLSKEGEVVRFVGFLSNIEEHAKELERRFEDIRPTLMQRLCTPEGRVSLLWTMDSQIAEYDIQEELP
ncbi:hypothetical protein C8T65DRAFT_664825 [Cerioporus squamosus]|nr:hypothetical protein C8T65DRAFT_664825 [Cerioporus squamosus]